MIRRETAQIAKGLPSSPAHWQEMYNEANDVSPPNSTAVNNVRLTCADSICVRARDCGILSAAKRQETKRTMLMVADICKSAHAEDGNGEMVMLERFPPFSAQLKGELPAIFVHDRKLRKPLKRWTATSVIW